MDAGRAEVMGWMSRTGRTASEAVDHFAPGCASSERIRLLARVRKWAQLERAAGSATAPERAQEPRGAPVPAPPPAPQEAGDNRETTEDLDPDAAPVDFLAGMLRDLLLDLRLARAERRSRDIPHLTRCIREVRTDLQRERERERNVVRLPRSPGAISAELERRAPAIALRAEMQRRKL